MKFRFTGETFITISIYLLGFYLCLPFSMTLLNSILIRMLVFFAAALFIGGMILLNRVKSLIIFTILFAFTFLYWQVTWRVALDEVSYVYYCFASLSFIFDGMILYSSKNEDRIKHLFLYFTVIYFVTAITSIIGLNIYPLASRELGRGSTYNVGLDFNTYKAIYRRMNIASWSQIYGMLFAVPVSLMVWRRKKSLFYIVFSGSLIGAIVASQITFAVLMMLAFIAAMCIPRNRRAVTIVFMSILLFVVAIVLMNLDYFLALAVNLSRDIGFSFLTTKLDDLKVLLLQRNAIGDVSARGELYQTSLNTFFKNPLLGLMVEGKATNEKIGFHSELFDLLGTLGVSGLIIMATAFISYWKFLRKTKEGTQRDLLIILCGFIGLFIFNPVFNSPQIFIGAFLYPLLASRYCDLVKSEGDVVFLKINDNTEGI